RYAFTPLAPPQCHPLSLHDALPISTASAKHLAEAGADSVTYFETAGWRGVLERADGPPDPDRFSSRPGAAFPLYHVLADLGEWQDRKSTRLNSSHQIISYAVFCLKK